MPKGTKPQFLIYNEIFQTSDAAKPRIFASLYIEKSTHITLPK